MTYENSLRLYKHYLAVGNTASAEELEAKYPKLKNIASESLKTPVEAPEEEDEVEEEDEEEPEPKEK